MGTHRRLKLLALHSFRTSGSIFREQMQRAGLDAALEDLIDVTYIDAPNAASGPIPDDVAPYFSRPYYEWWNASREGGEWQYAGWEASLAHISDALRLHGPFDGLIGFSQGAATAALLVGAQRAGCALAGLPPLRFCVCFAGIKARDPRLERCLAAARDCPSLHVVGDRDPVKRLTNELIESFSHPVVVNHPRGHVIPALQGEELLRVRAFLEAQAQESSL